MLRGKKRSRRGARPDMSGTRELELYADNEEPLYRQKRSIEQNLVRKLAAGKYDRTKAVKLWRYYADAAAKKYTREFGSSGSVIFSKAERDALAKREERQFFARVKASDPDLLVFVPKKYKKSKLCEVRRTNGTFKLDCNITLHGLRSRRRRR